MTRRRPPTRRARRTSKRRQQEDWYEQLALVLGVAVIAVGLVVMTVVNWLLAHWWVLVVLAVLAGTGWFCNRRRRARWEAVRAQGLRYGLAQLDALHHSRFEDAIRDLMHRDGCQDASRVGGGGTWARM